MGLMDLNAVHDSTNDVKEYVIKHMGGSKILFDFKPDCTFKHGDKITNLIKARVLEGYERNECIAPDTAKYVCFEIPTYITVSELADKKVFDKLNQVGKFDFLMPKNYNNMGLIDRQEDREYKLYSPTSQVLAYTRDVLDKQISTTGEMFTKRLKPEVKENIIIPEEKSIFVGEAVFNTPIELFLEEQFRYKMDGKVYTNYRGIDVEDGSYLNINRLAKIKDDSEQTLYSAYIHKMPRNKKVELKSFQDISHGIPVLFTSHKTIEDISKEDKKDDVEEFLKLVSVIPKSDNHEEEMIYIGGIDKEGTINRSKDNCSELIKQKIQEEQEKYKNSKKV